MKQNFRLNIKKIINLSLEKIFSRNQLNKFGRYIVNLANSENNGNPRSNGEYYFIHKIQKNLANKKTVIFDVGANVGEWSFEFLHGMTGNCTIYAFEPSCYTYNQLKENIRKNFSNKQIIPENIALSENNGKTEFFITGDIAGTNSLYLRQAESLGINVLRTEYVTLCKGDQFCIERDIKEIDFLKIDTEGHELSVLKGFESMLNKSKIGCIQFEYGGTWLDARIQLSDVFNYLVPKGYLIAKLFPKEIVFFENYDQQLDTFQYSNFVAMRQDWRNI